MRRIRILITDDSATTRRWLVECFARDPECEVVGEAVDGWKAFELCLQLRPDVVVMDLVMPLVDGLRAIEFIMTHCPTPIAILSAARGRVEGLSAMEALAAGAVAALEKPTAIGELSQEMALVRRIKQAARMQVAGRPRQRPAAARTEQRLALAAPRVPLRLVAMGASTGGPGAVREILRALPPDFLLPILLVLHLAEPFDASVVEWLGKQSALPVRKVEDGEPLPGVGVAGVCMAPANRHLVLQGGRLRLVNGPERHACRPSVDELFESVAREMGAAAIGCLLTGMGRDGAAGLAAMRAAGAPTLAQDEASSTIFGMPREAIRLGAAQYVVSLADIAACLASLARVRPLGGVA